VQIMEAVLIMINGSQYYKCVMYAGLWNATDRRT
jgi:hypothetical protein